MRLFIPVLLLTLAACGQDDARPATDGEKDAVSKKTETADEKEDAAQPSQDEELQQQANSIEEAAEKAAAIVEADAADFIRQQNAQNREKPE